MVGILVQHLDNYYAALKTDLDDLLDRAEPVADKLTGITTGDEAIDADLSAEWGELRSLSREYASLRSSHLSLLNYETSRNYGSGEALSGKELIGHAFFANVAENVPDYARIARGEVTDMHGKIIPVPLPWPVLDPSSLEHFLRAVRDRAALRPHVATADEAADARDHIVIADPGVSYAPREPGRLRAGSQEFEYVMARARSAGQARHAEEREEMHVYGREHAAELRAERSAPGGTRN